MHVLAAPDTFRGTATAAQVARSIADGVAGSDIRIGECTELPWPTAARARSRRSVAPTGGPRSPGRSGIGCWPTGGCPTTDRPSSNWHWPLGLILAGDSPVTTRGRRPPTRGTGELIPAAPDAGARRVVVGLGGSATTDGGRGAPGGACSGSPVGSSASQRFSTGAAGVLRCPHHFRGGLADFRAPEGRRPAHGLRSPATADRPGGAIHHRTLRRREHACRCRCRCRCRLAAWRARRPFWARAWFRVST